VEKEGLRNGPIGGISRRDRGYNHEGKKKRGVGKEGIRQGGVVVCSSRGGRDDWARKSLLGRKKRFEKATFPIRRPKEEGL